MFYTVNRVIVADMSLWNCPVNAKNRENGFFYDSARHSTHARSNGISAGCTVKKHSAH